MEPEQTNKKQPENNASNPTAERTGLSATEETAASPATEQRNRGSIRWLKSLALILLDLLLAVLVVRGTLWYVQRREYRAEHIVAAPKEEPVRIYYTPDDNAASAAANYLAYAMEQTLGLESELVNEPDDEFRGISILCGTEVPDEPEKKATIVFAAAAMSEDDAGDVLENAVYSLRLENDGVCILIPDRKNCFGAVKAITDRWLQTDCGVTGDGELVISQAMIDRYLLNLKTEVTGEIRILTQNLRNRDDGEGKTIEERSSRFFQLVEEYKPDLIGTQECIDVWLQKLQGALSDRYASFNCPCMGPDKGTSDSNAILYRKDRFTFLDGDTFWLSNTPSVVASKLNYNGVVRICTWVLLYDSETEKTILFSNTHLQNTIDDPEFYHEVRARQAEILLWKLCENENKLAKYPGFLTGDFNGSAKEPFYSLITEVYDDARISAVAEDSTVDFTWHNYGDRHSLIDYCFHSKGSISILDYRILDDWYDGYVSDHYGILVTAVVNEAAMT